MDERDYKAMNKELQEETEKNCIGCMFFSFVMPEKGYGYCYNQKSSRNGHVKEKGPSCELKQIRK